MLGTWSLSAVLPLLLLATFAEAAVKLYISTAAEISTECKTCPRSLCPNQLYYYREDPLNVTCWTRGTKMVGDRLWLRSEAGCYVTIIDLVEYAGDFTDDLEYCGPDSEEQNLTIEDATLKYKTECRICPFVTCEVMAYLREDTDVELTCWVPEGQLIIDDPTWAKTTNNCYVAQKNLYSKPDITYLDKCGPIPPLEYIDHHDGNGTTDVNKRHAPQKRDDMSAKYLVNVTIGEEYAPCRTCTKDSCETKKVYQFDQQIYIQCISEVNQTTWWAETVDFCYVKETYFWQSIWGDYYRQARCEDWGDSPEEGTRG